MLQKNKTWKCFPKMGWRWSLPFQQSPCKDPCTGQRNIFICLSVSSHMFSIFWVSLLHNIQISISKNIRNIFEQLTFSAYSGNCSSTIIQSSISHNIQNIVQQLTFLQHILGIAPSQYIQISISHDIQISISATHIFSIFWELLLHHHPAETKSGSNKHCIYCKLTSCCWSRWCRSCWCFRIDKKGEMRMMMLMVMLMMRSLEK